MDPIDIQATLNQTRVQNYYQKTERMITIEQQERSNQVAQKSVQRSSLSKSGRARSSQSLLGSSQNRQYLSMVASPGQGLPKFTNQARQSFLPFEFSQKFSSQFEAKTARNSNHNQVSAALENFIAAERDVTRRVQNKQRLITSKIFKMTRATQILHRNHYEQAVKLNLFTYCSQKLKNSLLKNHSSFSPLTRRTFGGRSAYISLCLLGSVSAYSFMTKYQKAQNSGNQKYSVPASEQQQTIFNHQGSLKDYLAYATQRTATNSILAIFDSYPISVEWKGWLNQAFQQSQTHDALLFLLVNGICDQRFIDKSIVYGLDLLDVAFRSKQVLDASLYLVDQCLVQEQKVVDQAVELCRWFATHETVKELTSEIMCRTHFRADLCEVMTWQTACAGYDSTMTDEVRQCAFDEGFKAVGTERFMDGAYNSLVSKTLSDFATFGLYSWLTEPEDLVQESNLSSTEEVTKDTQ